MLMVDQYDYIRTAHRVYGKKIKQIARETGIFPVLIYDNLTTVAQKVFRGKRRILQESYGKFPSIGPFHFPPFFC